MDFVVDSPPKSYSNMSLIELIDLIQERCEAKEERMAAHPIAAQHDFVIKAANIEDEEY
jgi:hypothetical protein